MKKILLATACFALMLGSCVKNVESESVTALRDAQKELLLSQAAVNNAEAAAMALLAEADAAIKKAQAEAMAVETAIREVQKQLLEVELESAKADLELKLAKLEAKKAEIAAQMEEAAVLAEQALIDAKNALEASKKTYLDTLAGVEAAKAARLTILFGNYTDAVEALINAKGDVITATAKLVGVEKALVSAEEYRDETIATNEKAIAENERLIAIEEKHIELINSYSNVTVEEATIARDEALLELNALEVEAVKATDAYNEIGDLLDELGYPEDTEYIAALEAFYSLLTCVTYEEWDEYHQYPYYYVPTQYDENGLAWWGYEIPGDVDPVTGLTETTFVPLVCPEVLYSDLVTFSYNLESTVVPVELTYDTVEVLGGIDTEAFAEYLAYLEKNPDTSDYAYIAEMRPIFEAQLAGYKAYEPVLKNLIEGALAWAVDYDAYQALYKDVNEVYSEEVDYANSDPYMGLSYLPTTYGKYVMAQDAVNAANAAKTAAETAKTNADTAKATAVADEAAAKADVAAKEADVAAKKAALAAATDEADKAVKEAELEAAEAALVAAQETAAEAAAALAEATREATYAADVLTAATEKATAAAEALETAKEAYDAQVAKLPAALEASENGRHEYEMLYAENEELHAKYAVDMYEYDYSIGYIVLPPVAYLQKQYGFMLDAITSTEETLAYWDELDMTESTTDKIEQIEKQLALVEVLTPGAEEYVKAYNEAVKALNEEIIPAYDLAWDRWNLKNAEMAALNAAIAGADTVQGELDNCQANIDGYKQNIEDLKALNEQVSNLATQEQAIEDAKTRLELAQANVEFCQARADAAKAAWEAAEQE